MYDLFVKIRHGNACTYTLTHLKVRVIQVSLFKFECVRERLTQTNTIISTRKLALITIVTLTATVSLNCFYSVIRVIACR